MVISRQFKIALLISFFWHLFWICSVSITFVPSGFNLRRYSSVSFLGSILSSPVSIGRVALLKQKHLVEFPAEADIGRGISHFNKGPSASLPTQKASLRLEAIVDVDLPKEPAVSLAGFVQAEPLLERKIIFQPALPEYPEWAGSRENRAGAVIFKIYISAQGMVEQPICVQGSGNPEIDAALARYVSRWRFAPVLKPKVQTQTVKINLDFK